MNILLLDINHFNAERLADSYGITPNWKTLKLKDRQGFKVNGSCTTETLYVNLLICP